MPDSENIKSGGLISAKRFRGKGLLLVCVLIVMVLAAIAALFITNKKNELDVQKVNQVVLTDECQSGLQKLDGQNPDPKKIEESIKLLNYKARCLSAAGKYKETLTILGELKEYYAKANDQGGIASVNQQIKNTNYNMNNPGKAIPVDNVSSESFQETMKTVEEARNQSQ